MEVSLLHVSYCPLLLEHGTILPYPGCRMLSLLLQVPVHCSVLRCSTRAVSFSSVLVKETEASEISWMSSMQIQS